MGPLASLDTMPIHWTIDSRLRLMTVVAEGDVTRPEFEAYLDVVDKAELYPYRKLFDGSGGDPRMSPDDLLALGVRMRSVHHTQPVGPLAVVVPDDKIDLVCRVLGMLAAANRPMRVFNDAAPARDWILKQPT
jgi:hypothetical protein